MGLDDTIRVNTIRDRAVGRAAPALGVLYLLAIFLKHGKLNMELITSEGGPATVLTTEPTTGPTVDPTAEDEKEVK